MDLHIDDFYKDIALGLLALYQAFPRKVDLYVEDLIGPQELDEYGLPSSRQQSCFSALLWLADEGYLRYSSPLSHNALEQCTLTEKAFLRLALVVSEDDNLPPSVMRVKGTLAYLMREALYERNTEKLIEQVKRFFPARDTA